MSDSLRAHANQLISEMREFASFTPKEQRFIKLGIEIAADQEMYEVIFLRWSRNLSESRDITSRQQVYLQIDRVKELIPEGFSAGAIDSLMGPLIDFSNYDLIQGYIESFGAYRFLYERLFGVKIRPWLPSTFCAAAAMPNIVPDKRRTLLQSLSEAAATAPAWSKQKPIFFPEWVDKSN
jgi:hypothetical protein